MLFLLLTLPRKPSNAAIRSHPFYDMVRVLSEAGERKAEKANEVVEGLALDTDIL